MKPTTTLSEVLIQGRDVAKALARLRDLQVTLHQAKAAYWAVADERAQAIAALIEMGLTPTELAGHLGVRKPAVYRALKRCEELRR